MTTQEIEDFVIEELHNYSAWVLKHPDTEPLERRAEKSRRAKLILTTLITKVREEAYKAGYIKGGIDEQITYNLSLEKIRAEEMERVKKWLTLNAIAFTTQKQEEDFLAFLSAPTKTDNKTEI